MLCNLTLDYLYRPTPIEISIDNSYYSKFPLMIFSLQIPSLFNVRETREKMPPNGNKLNNIPDTTSINEKLRC